MKSFPACFNAYRPLTALGMVALLLPSLGTGCSSHADKPDVSAMAQGPYVAGAREGVYLRASFDSDPSMYIGRFISPGVSPDEIDENRGVQTSCSQYITYREVNAAGQFDEYYQSSSSVKASLGLQAPAISAAPSGDASVGNERTTNVRVRYNLKKKLVAHIEDFDAYNTCCESSADACSGQYIGEFWSGEGTLFQNTGRSTDVDVSAKGGPELGGTAYQVGGDVEIADGWAWRRAITFEDVYFAFRVVDAEITGCGWVDRPPQSDEGQYFVGISPPAATGDMARTMAMRNARTQVVQYLGEAIVSESITRASLQGYLEDEQVVATAAEGIASRVKDERYCPAETVESPEGLKYIARVLAFFPYGEEERARREMVKSIADQTGDQEVQALEDELAADATDESADATGEEGATGEEVAP
ncbi:hypothetical protein DL240_07630 [Lujinxingia litoralis]|uniref:Uncharacterized protein n=1 Tax=Lujinxingia litoralis TaxID=2211119 RepID=A0A328C5B6_9DELT|nr:hypothetical protein [Lujinxingia litoralis]RAL22761.1 hypothetical protein DL240_07630 [Lujinxingia litoralis]